MYGKFLWVTPTLTGIMFTPFFPSPQFTRPGSLSLVSGVRTFVTAVRDSWTNYNP